MPQPRSSSSAGLTFWGEGTSTPQGSGETEAGEDPAKQPVGNEEKHWASEIRKFAGTKEPNEIYFLPNLSMTA